MALTKPPVKNVWAETGDKTEPSGAEVLTGWPLSSIPPSRQRFNWILNFLSNGVRYLTRRGISDWAADETYEIGDYARGPDNLSYRALTSNINKTPAANPGDWIRWGFTKEEIQAFTDGYLSKSVAGGATVNLTADEARNGIINLTGLLTANISVTIPATAKRLTIINSTTGAFTVTVKTPLGTGVVVEQGSTSIVHCDGTNVDFSHKSGATASQFANDLKLATTEFVQRALGNYSGFKLVTATEALTAAEVGKAIQLNDATLTLTLPPTAGIPDGARLDVFSVGTANTKTISPAAGDTITSWGSALGSFTIKDQGNLVFVKRSTEWRIIDGTLALKYATNFGALLSGNGYQKLPSGLIIQWGSATLSGGSNTVTLPVTFPTACQAVLTQNRQTQRIAYVSALAAANFTAVSQDTTSGGSASSTIYFIAVGY